MVNRQRMVAPASLRSCSSASMYHRTVFSSPMRRFRHCQLNTLSSDLGHVQPTAVFRGVVKLKPSGNAPRFGGLERLVKRPSSDEAPAVTAGASGLFQTAAVIPTLTAAPRALPAIPQPSADGGPVERPRRFRNTLGGDLTRHGRRHIVGICLRNLCRQMSSAI